MKPTRRAILGSSLGAAALGATAWGALRAASRRDLDGARSLEIRAVPITSLEKAGSSRRRFGDLTFRSGLVLTSRDAGFGGLSGLWRAPEGGDSFVALSDQGQWLTASVQYEGGRLIGLSAARMAPILGADGVPLQGTSAYDTEALAMANGVAYVGIERVHEVRSFDWAGAGILARGERMPLPPETRDLPSNSSFEAVAVAPAGHPLAGAVVAIAEEARKGADAPTKGWVVTGPDRFAFDVARSDDFDITDAGFLSSGELLLLERRYTPIRGVACRMRRIAPDAIRAGATIDGRIILALDDTFEIDNMEGLAIHRDAASGETILTLVSDDNFSPVQRTVLLEFALGSQPG